MNRGVLRRRNALAAAQCLIGTLWFFLLTEEVKMGEDLYPLPEETVVSTVARMLLDIPAKAGKHAPSIREPVEIGINDRNYTIMGDQR